MEKTTRTDDQPTQRQSHCFPDLERQTDQRQTGHAEACSIFRPMYPCENDSNATDQVSEAESSVLKQSYQQGFEKGKKEACQLVQQDLAPQLSIFDETFSTLSSDLNRLLSVSGKNITALASVIAEKILLKPLKYTTSWCEQLESQMQETFTTAYGMKVILNPDDFEMLESVFENTQRLVNKDRLLRLCTHPDVPRGTIRQANEPLPLAEAQLNEMVKLTSPHHI